MTQHKGAPRTPKSSEIALAELELSERILSLLETHGIKIPEAKRPQFELDMCLFMDVRPLMSAARAEGFQEGAAQMRERVADFVCEHELFGPELQAEILALPLTEEGV